MFCKKLRNRSVHCITAFWKVLIDFLSDYNAKYSGSIKIIENKHNPECSVLFEHGMYLSGRRMRCTSRLRFGMIKPWQLSEGQTLRANISLRENSWTVLFLKAVSSDGAVRYVTFFVLCVLSFLRNVTLTCQTSYHLSKFQLFKSNTKWQYWLVNSHVICATLGRTAKVSGRI